MANFNKNHTEIAQAEHISPEKTGDNIAAKRSAGYIFNPASGVWERNTGDVVALATRIDDSTTANVTYIGKAPIASATSSAVWQITKLDTASGLIKTWADGNGSFDNVWDDRASLSYS